MANDTVITVCGNLVSDPELRYTQAGVPVASFTIASTPRKFNRQTNEWEDEEALFLRCSAWRSLGENIGASLTKGSRVIAQGRLRQRSYQDKEGNQRTSVELDVDDIGPSLVFATAQVQRVQSGQARNGQAPSQGHPQGQPQGRPQGQPQEPWAPQGQPPQTGQYSGDVPW